MKVEDIIQLEETAEVIGVTKSGKCKINPPKGWKEILKESKYATKK